MSEVSVDSRAAQTPHGGDEPVAPEEVRREWLGYRESETLTGLSRTTLWKLINAGEIKAARVGRAVRLNRRSLEAYLERATDVSEQR
jgi:excisionase family DNA binding protein